VGPHPHDLYLATFGRSTMLRRRSAQSNLRTGPTPRLYLEPEPRTGTGTWNLEPGIWNLTN